MIQLTEEAAKDIENMLEHSVAEFGLQQTEEYYNSLKKCLVLLDENPAMGTLATDLLPAYRRFTHISHVIFYRIIEQDILIVRILHKRMDISKLVEE